ncbi:MAG: diacylglycerol kinase family protein [Anaerolineae bacterium]|nr:diacylglycerol kinase family protein [Anaerolineae bacterium]
MGKFLLSFVFAWQGIVHAFRSQRNFRVHTAIALGAVAVGLGVGLDATRWAIIAVTIGLVFSAELVNTALEAAVDLATDDLKPLAKVAKDTAAGAVVVAAASAVAVGVFILGPPLLRLAGRLLR